jgi:hypothetical protein
MTVHGLQDVVDKYLRSIERGIYRSDERLSKMTDNWIDCPLAPDQALHSWLMMRIGDLIQGFLRDIDDQRIERTRDEAGRAIFQIVCTDASYTIGATRYPPLAEEFLDEGYGLKLHHHNVTLFTINRTRRLWETAFTTNSGKRKWREFRYFDFSHRRML